MKWLTVRFSINSRDVWGWSVLVVLWLIKAFLNWLTSTRLDWRQLLHSSGCTSCQKWPAALCLLWNVFFMHSVGSKWTMEQHKQINTSHQHPHSSQFSILCTECSDRVTILDCHMLYLKHWTDFDRAERWCISRQQCAFPKWHWQLTYWQLWEELNHL